MGIKSKILKVVIFVLSSGANAASYQLIDLGTLGGNMSRAYGINASGQVVGTSNSTYYGNNANGFYWENGTMNSIGTLGGNTSVARDINDSGMITGTSQTSSGQQHAFRWEPGAASGSMVDLGTTGGTASHGMGINNNGQIAGESNTGVNNNTEAVRWDGNTTTSLGVGNGGNFGRARGMNDSGRIVGSSGSTTAGYWRPNGSFVNLEPYPGSGATSIANDINEQNQIVGWIQDYEHRAVIWQNGSRQLLDELYYGHSEAYGINENGQAVGEFDVFIEDENYNFSYERHAFIWDSESQITDLNDLLINGDGWTLQTASDINDNGQIVGSAIFGGQTRAFLLNPVPVPAAVWLFGSGLIGLVGLARRKKA